MKKRNNRPDEKQKYKQNLRNQNYIEALLLQLGSRPHHMDKEQRKKDQEEQQENPACVLRRTGGQIKHKI